MSYAFRLPDAAFGLLLGVCSVGLTSASIAVPKTPTRVVEEFCRLDADGRQLTPDGWRTISSLFVEPGTPHHGKVTIVKDCAVSDARIADGDKADVYAEYLALAILNPETAALEQGSLPPGGVSVRNDFHLILTDANSPHAAWRITGPVPEPHMTVDAAIRYVTALRDKTTDPRIRKNAERALVGLKKQQHSPH
jgi:hypothetical protein